MLKRLHALFTGATAIAQDAPEVTQPIQPDAELIYPYVVPQGYLRHGVPQPDGITRPLGHGLHIALVHDLNGMVRNVLPEDLKTVGLTAAQAQKKADQNLGRLITTGKVGSTVFPNGPGSKPFALFGGHWAAATSITWTGLYDAMQRALGTEDLLVCIPHRETMLVFPIGPEDYIEAVKAMIREKESNGRKPLTMELFRLTKAGLQPQNTKG